MVNSKSELTNLESFKFNSKRSSLRNFKNWSPFTDNSENNDTKKSEKDDYLTNKTGIVRRMANSISSQLLNKSNIERPKSNILPRSRNSFSASTKTDNKDEILYSTIKPKIKISKPNEANESNLYLKETVQGINVQLKEPHLICVSTDAKNQLNKTSIKIYPLKIGKTTIGSCSKNDFVIKGPGIEPEHCFIENNLKFKSSENLAIKYPSSNNYRRSLTSIFRRNKTKDSINSNNLITLNPISKLCALDGVLIESPCVLTSGESEYFRFNNPISENNLNDRKEQKFIADDRNFKSEKIHSIQNSASGQEKLTQLNSKNIDKLKEIRKEKMLSNQEQESQIIGLETLKSDCDPMDKDLDSKDNDDKKLSKVRFNLPEKKTLVKNNESNLAEDKKKNLNNKIQIILGINDHKNRSERVTIENKPKSVSVRKAPNKNFLSKITKFELLSRGITKIDDLISSSSQSDISSCSIKLDLNEEKMLRQNLSKKEFLKIREIRSKSFGCEKELHLKRKQKKSQVKSSAKNEVKIDSSKKPFNLEESLNYIDDDISHSNENRESNTNDSDDSDDNVIYEGDSADELNDFLEEDDFENFDSSDTDSDEILKCRSAPISPTRNLNKQESDKKSTTNNNCASFIYNVNLYNDQHNLVILNTQDEFKRNLKNLKKIEKNSSSSTDSCSSESSLNSHLEPLVINEENSINLTTSSNKITVIPFVKNSQTDLNILCSTSSSSSSSSKDMNSQQLEIDKALSPSSSSESSCNEQEDKIEEILKTDDSASLTDDNSQSSSSNLLSESQYFLKDNYEKAKREREIEQQLAEMEKKRLQEILDICLEFQKQEQGKLNAVNNIEKIQNSSTVSSLSSNQSQNQQIIISELPSLNTILNSANNKDKISPSSTNRNSTNSITPSKDIIIEFQQQQQQQQQPQQLQNNKNQQCQQQTKNHIDKLTKEKCELISSLNSIKQKIKDIEMRQSEALRDLEMERALLDVEQTSELKLIQSEENKLKHLHQEHQLKLEAFNIHTNQIRNEIKIVQMTIKNIENEILILDTTLDTNFFLSTGNCLDLDWENLKNQKEHALEEARRAHEDLEFQLMELEAKYETELEDIQTRLIKEQEILIESFKQKQHNLTTFDHEQQKIILQIKSETEILELERLNLIEQFKKHRNQLESIEKKLQKIGDYQSLDVNLDNQENVSQEDSPSPASSSVSLSSATNSSETNPSSSVNQPRYVYPSILPQILQCSLNQNKTNNYKKHLSQSFRDILENTMLINGISEANNRNYINLNPNYSKNQRLSINKSLGSLNNQTTVIAANVSCLTGSVNNQSKMNSSQQHLLMEQNMDEFIDDLEKKLSSPISNQLAIKFANLERSLAMSKAENNNLLEQQYQARERELFLLQEEKRKREDLERQLNEEKNLRLKICEENIKLRDKKQTQARPLTRYLPVRDNNFDLKLHVENSGHNLLNQIDPNTKQPLIYINSNSCRGYLLKMGQKFKTWNKRWFVFDRNKRTLCYYLDKHETKLRGSIYFQSINEVYVDHMRTIKTPDSKSTFVVKTIDRNFYLVAPSSELMRIWIDVIFTGAEGYLEFFE